ncbi:uncharacterized protein LOC120663901 [Panicum virgatum]|uniref:Uncharacterized protein n=1 Tax=Panicum virgatum TaxID=38727 RepID=A0A8T0U498_PANVG|nr:uncharacterized protein LOC120663901 [Panicum virgatum]KAG2615624.1 hypothetical protein PVAP13_3NG047500 [Panicum virgatum]
MLRRAASTLDVHAAAWLRRLPRRPAMPLPPLAQLGSHHPRAQLQPRRGLPHLGGARGYRHMARRIPAARPDGYSTSEGELEEEPDEWAREEIPEPDAAGEEGDDSEGSEVEGYMLDFGALRDELGKKEEERPQRVDHASSGGARQVLEETPVRRRRV